MAATAQAAERRSGEGALLPSPVRRWFCKAKAVPLEPNGKTAEPPEIWLSRAVFDAKKGLQRGLQRARSWSPLAAIWLRQAVCLHAESAVKARKGSLAPTVVPNAGGAALD
jgi:hypothetical protein